MNGVCAVCKVQIVRDALTGVWFGVRHEDDACMPYGGHRPVTRQVGKKQWVLRLGPNFDGERW